MKSSYKTLIVKSIKFLLCLIFLDVVIGNLAGFLFYSQQSGKYERITTSMEEATGDLLIFGSSHANRNYVPETFEETLNLSCYNAGVQGQKILFHSTLQEIMLNRFSPKVILLTLDPNWLYHSQKTYDLLADLHPYYWKYKQSINPVIALKSKYEPWKMFSNAYRYNSTIVHIIKYFFIPQEDYKGYRPLYGTALLPEVNPEDIPLVKKEEALDSNFIKALTQFTERAISKDIKVVFAISPRYNRVDYSQNESFIKIKSIAKQYKIPFYDYLFHDAFLNQPDLFYDAIHLNHKGALKYSKLISTHMEEAFMDELSTIENANSTQH